MFTTCPTGASGTPPRPLLDGMASARRGAFVPEMIRRHPHGPNPLVAGNRQGGWGTLLMAATNPDLTGPLVIKRAPVATWRGEVGANTMRYTGGVLGGAWHPRFWSDLGGGVFDGSHQMMNFEMLNPSRNLFRKCYDLFAEPETGRRRCLESERWWGGFYLLNEATSAGSSSGCASGARVTAAKAGAASIPSSPTSRPSRTRRRQVSSCHREIPCRRAVAETSRGPAMLSATMRSFSASLHRRRLPVSTTSSRETRPLSILPCIQTGCSHSHPGERRPLPEAHRPTRSSG
jgi:hypothetical protein